MREKSHERALEDIAAQASNEEEIPEVAFAAFVFDERTDFTHSTSEDAELSAVIDAMATHVAAISDGTGYSVPEILEVVGEAAAAKQADGRHDWGGP